MNDIAEVSSWDPDQCLQYWVCNAASKSISTRAAHQRLEEIDAKCDLLNFELCFGIIGPLGTPPRRRIVELEFFFAEEFLVGGVAPSLKAVPIGYTNKDAPSHLHNPPKFLHGPGGLGQVLEDVVHVDFLKDAIVPRPGKLGQVVDDINPREGSNIVVNPTFFDEVAAADVEFGFHGEVRRGVVAVERWDLGRRSLRDWRTIESLVVPATPEPLQRNTRIIERLGRKGKICGRCGSIPFYALAETPFDWRQSMRFKFEI